MPVAPRVLVVDDEPAAREVACMWLDELGYQAAAAASPREALDHLEREPFDVLFADVFLADSTDGFELALHALKRQPSLKVFFASARAWGPSQRSNPMTTLLHKPYSRAELASTLQFVVQA